MSLVGDEAADQRRAEGQNAPLLGVPLVGGGKLSPLCLFSGTVQGRPGHDSGSEAPQR